MNLDRFIFDTPELEALSAFEDADGLEGLSKKLGRDPTVISRMLKRISDKAPVLEKIAGRWRLTEMGRKLNSISKDMILAQGAVLNEHLTLRIGSNREFVSRVLVPSLQKLKDDLDLHSISVKTFEGGVEKPLLEGQVDIALDCGRPETPEISFKHCLKEPISIVCSPVFFKRHRTLFESDRHQELPMIQCERLLSDRISGEAQTGLSDFHFNDISAARAACVLGLGWMYLPLYAVKEEVRSKKLVRPYAREWGQEKYGVWWLRSRKHLLPQVKVIESWLSAQTLDC